ncbi:Na+/H+ antiporter subunit E [Aliiglaciecola litoralis]|uniref:Na+/H+ antiporter subunit E n=1 Tax=Aliiglaciecola litoralis TaxID=582857 RepID=A0ABP3WY14_9ALTE
MALWLLLSGHYNALLISLGVVSVLFTLYMSKRMDAIDHESHPIHISAKLIKFWVLLAGKVFTANIDVALRILGFRPTEPQLIKLKLNQCSDLTKVIYANAITLTPGSASLHIEDGYLYVHTISKQGAQDLLNGDMEPLIPLYENNNTDMQQ